MKPNEWEYVKKLAQDVYPELKCEDVGYGTMNNLILLETTKASDRVLCSHCHKGYWVPSNPAAEYNSWFTCSHCGAKRHIDRNVIVE